MPTISELDTHMHHPYEVEQPPTSQVGLPIHGTVIVTGNETENATLAQHSPTAPEKTTVLTGTAVIVILAHRTGLLLQVAMSDPTRHENGRLRPLEHVEILANRYHHL